MSGESSKFKTFLKKLIVRLFPILKWSKNYTKEEAVSDLIAGITISLIMIPQTIAYASLANLTPEYGLNSAFMGCLVYVFMGNIREVVIGPSSLMALLTLEYTFHLNIDCVILLSFMCGIVELIMGLLRLGFFVELISAPVVSGFTSATSILIVVSQIKGILGIRFNAKGCVGILTNLYNKINETNKGDVLLGISCIVALLLLRKVKDIKVGDKIIGRKYIKHLLWFITTARNATIVLVSALISLYFLNNGTKPPFITTGHVPSGIPSFRFPPTHTEIGNKTYTFTEMVDEMKVGILVIPIVSVLANVAIGKAFSSNVVDGTQEMLALAVSNILGSCVQAMPSTGAFTRSAVISASGVRTPMANLYSAILTLIALQYLSVHFHLIPHATLSAILIAAVIFLVDYQIILPLWRSNKFDFMVLILTFVMALSFGVECGLVAGVFLGLARLIYFWARPSIEVEQIVTQSGKYIKINPRLGFYFPAVDYINTAALKEACKNPFTPIVIDCINFLGADYTAAKSLSHLKKVFIKRKQQLIYVNVHVNISTVWENIDDKEKPLYCHTEELEQLLFGDSEATVGRLKNIAESNVTPSEQLRLLKT